MNVAGISRLLGWVCATSALYTHLHPFPTGIVQTMHHESITELGNSLLPSLSIPQEPSPESGQIYL